MQRRPFTIDEYVRWSDVDHAGIIFYGAYVRFFEIAETEMFRSVGLPYGELFDRLEIWLPRVHLDCDFTYPARLDDQLRVVAYVPRIGTSSITLQFDVVHLGTGRLAAAGHEVLVSTDRKTLRPTPLPAELRRALGPYALGEAEARSALGLTSEVGA
jgi:YbgC/YbaW family acyl-CoA thioester hydrolase